MNVKVFVSAALALFLMGSALSFSVAYLINKDEAVIENQQATNTATQKDIGSTEPVPTKQPASQEQTKTQNTSTVSTPKTNPAPAPKPVLSCGNGGSCSVADVARHSTAGDCWGIYQGKVFNLTSYVPKHDGGSAAFNNQSCGGDMTNYLNGSSGSGGVKAHRHSQKAYSILNSYYIADLK